MEAITQLFGRNVWPGKLTTGSVIVLAILFSLGLNSGLYGQNITAEKTEISGGAAAIMEAQAGVKTSSPLSSRVQPRTYRVTGEALEFMRSEGLDEEIVRMLEPLKDREALDKTAFRELLETVLGAKGERYAPSVMKYL